MFLVQGIDVIRAVVSPVHDQLDLLIAKDIQFAEQFTNRFDIRNVPGKLTVVERQAGVFSEDQGQIDLRKLFPILVLSVLDLPQALRITGYRSAVISPVFLFNPSLSLQTEELHLCVLRNGLEKLRTPLRGNGIPVRVFMEHGPLLKTEERISVLQDQVIDDRLELFIGMRKTGL